MSVYRPIKSRFFHYDFTCAGRRHRGSLRTSDYRSARRLEALIKEQAGYRAAREADRHEPPRQEEN